MDVAAQDGHSLQNSDDPPNNCSVPTGNKANNLDIEKGTQEAEGMELDDGDDDDSDEGVMIVDTGQDEQDKEDGANEDEKDNDAESHISLDSDNGDNNADKNDNTTQDKALAETKNPIAIDDLDDDEQPEASLVIDESSNDVELSVSACTTAVEQDEGLEDSQGTQASTGTTDSSVSTPLTTRGKSTPIGKGSSKGRSRTPVGSEISPDTLEKYVFPSKHGWKREVVFRNVTSGKRGQCDIYYFTPTGKKLRSMVELENWLNDHKQGPVQIHHFTLLRKPISGPPFENVRGAGKPRRQPNQSNSEAEATPTPKKEPVKKAVKPSLAESTTPSSAQSSAKRVVKKTKKVINSLQLRSRTSGSGFKSILSSPQPVSPRESPVSSLTPKEIPVTNSPRRLAARRSFKSILSSPNVLDKNDTPVAAKNSDSTDRATSPPAEKSITPKPSQPAIKSVVRTGPKIKYVPTIKSKTTMAQLRKKLKPRSPDWRPSDESSDDSDSNEHRESSSSRNVEVIKYGVSGQDSASGNQDEIQSVFGTPSKLISSIVNPELHPPKPAVPLNLDQPSPSSSYKIILDKAGKQQIVQLASPAPSSVRYRLVHVPQTSAIPNSGSGIVLLTPKNNQLVNTNTSSLLATPGMPILQPRPQPPCVPLPLSQPPILLPPPPPLASRPNFPRAVIGSSNPISLLPHMPRIIPSSVAAHPSPPQLSPMVPAPQISSLAPPGPQISSLAPPGPQISSLAPPGPQISSLAPPGPQISSVAPAPQLSVVSPAHSLGGRMLPLPQLQHCDARASQTPSPPIPTITQPTSGHTTDNSSLLISSLTSPSLTTGTPTSLPPPQPPPPPPSSTSETTGTSAPGEADKDLVDQIFNNLPNFLNMSINDGKRRRRDPLVNNLASSASRSSSSPSSNIHLNPNGANDSSSLDHADSDSAKKRNVRKSFFDYANDQPPKNPSQAGIDKSDVGTDDSDDDALLPISFGNPSAQGNDGEDDNSDSSEDSENQQSESKEVSSESETPSVITLSDSDPKDDGSTSATTKKKSKKSSRERVAAKLKRFLAFRRVQDNLPSMLNIFKHLSIYDLLRVGCVCRSWYRISRMSCLWQSVEVKSSFEEHWQSAVRFFIKVGVSNLTIPKLPNFGGTVAVEEIIKALSRLTQLKKLQFHEIPQQVLTRIMESMPHLENVGAKVILDAEPMGGRSKFSWNTFPKELAMSKAVDAIVEKKMSVKAAATMCCVSESELRHLMVTDQSALRRQEEDSVLLCCMRMARMGFTITLPFTEQRMEEEMSKRPELCRPPDHILKLSCFQLIERNKHMLQNSLPYNPFHSMVSKIASYSLFLQKHYEALKISAAMSVLAFVMKKFSVLNQAGNRFCNVTALSLLSAENIPIPTMLIFSNTVLLPESINKLILVGTKDGLPTPNIVTHYLRAVFSELKKRPLIIFFDGNENLIADQLVSESINSSIHFHCVPKDIANVMFPGNHGGVLNKVFKSSQEGTMRVKEQDFVKFVGEEIKLEARNRSQQQAFAKTGIYPVKAKASIDLYTVLRNSTSEPIEVNGDDSNEDEEDSDDPLSDESGSSDENGSTPQTSTMEGKFIHRTKYKDLLKNKLLDKINASKKQLSVTRNSSGSLNAATHSRNIRMDESGDKGQPKSSETGKKRAFSAIDGDDKTDPGEVSGQGPSKKLKESEENPVEMTEKSLPGEISQSEKDPQEQGPSVNLKESEKKAPPPKRPTKTQNKAEKKNVSSVESILETIGEVIARSREEYEAKEKETLSRPPLKLKLSSSKGLLSVSGVGEKASEKQERQKVKRTGNESFDEEDDEEEEEWESVSEVEEEKEKGNVEKEKEEEEENDDDDDEEEEEEEESDDEEEKESDNASDEEKKAEINHEQNSEKQVVEENDDDDDKENKNVDKNEQKVDNRNKKIDENEVSSDVSEEEVEEICSDEEEMDTSQQAAEADSEMDTSVQDKKKEKKKKKKKHRHRHHSSVKENSSLNESSEKTLSKHKKKKKKRKKKKSKNKEEDSSAEKSKDEIATVNTSTPAEESESISEPAVCEEKKDKAELRREFTRLVSMVDHDYETKFDSDSGTEAPLEDSVHEVKMDWEEEKSDGQGDGVDEVTEVEKVDDDKPGEANPAEGEGKEDGTSDSESSSSSSSDSDSGSGNSSSSSSSSSGSGSGSARSSSDSDSASGEEESSEKVSGKNIKRKSKEEKSKEQSDSEESSSSAAEEDSPEEEDEEGEEEEEEAASSEAEQEEEDDDDDEEEEDEDSKCQLCMLSNPPHSKDQVINWVDCDGNCGRWFHVICIMRSQAKANPKHYVCPSCRCKR